MMEEVRVQRLMRGVIKRDFVWHSLKVILRHSPCGGFESLTAKHRKGVKKFVYTQTR